MDDRRPVLLTQPAKIVRRRRTAEEAGFSVPNFDVAEPRPRWPKIQRREKHEVLKEEERPAPTIPPTNQGRRPLKYQASVVGARLESVTVIDAATAPACDWPMTGKERAQPSHVGRRVDDVAGLNVTFPLVYDISQSMSDTGEIQAMDEDAMETLLNATESCQIPIDGAQFDFNAVLSKLRNVQQRESTNGGSGRRRSIDNTNMRTAVTAFSKLSVSERAKSGACSKTKKRPVYLLIIFASVDADQRLKCDAYITCVNRMPTGRSQQSFGINWMMSQMMDMFEKQQAASGRFSGNQKSMIACCLVEALAHNPRLLSVNAYWRHMNEGGQAPQLEFLRQIAYQFQNGIENSATSSDLANTFTTIAVTAADQLAAQTLTTSTCRTQNTMLSFDNGGCPPSVIGADRSGDNLALAAMMSRAACWLLEDFNRLNVQQLMTPQMSALRSEPVFNRLT